MCLCEHHQQARLDHRGSQFQSGLSEPARACFVCVCVCVRVEGTCGGYSQRQQASWVQRVCVTVGRRSLAATPSALGRITPAEQQGYVMLCTRCWQSDVWLLRNPRHSFQYSQSEQQLPKQRPPVQSAVPTHACSTPHHTHQTHTGADAGH